MYLLIQLLGIYKAYVSNLSLLVCLEPFKKFSVGGWWWWVGNTVNIVFCFGPRLGPKTGVLAQAEQKFFVLNTSELTGLHVLVYVLRNFIPEVEGTF